MTWGIQHNRSIKGNPCPLLCLALCLSLAQALILAHPQWGPPTPFLPLWTPLDF